MEAIPFRLLAKPPRNNCASRRFYFFFTLRSSARDFRRPDRHFCGGLCRRGGCGGAACSRRPQSRPRLSAGGADAGLSARREFRCSACSGAGRGARRSCRDCGADVRCSAYRRARGVGFAFRRACRHPFGACFHSSARRTSRRLHRCPCRGLCRRDARDRRGGNGAFPSPPRQRRGRPLLRRGAVHCSGGTMGLADEKKFSVSCGSSSGGS